MSLCAEMSLNTLGFEVEETVSPLVIERNKPCQFILDIFFRFFQLFQCFRIPVHLSCRLLLFLSKDYMILQVSYMKLIINEHNNMCISVPPTPANFAGVFFFVSFAVICEMAKNTASDA